MGLEGSTKRKELHGRTAIRALSGTWGEQDEGATFQAYKFDFSCSVIYEIYSGFVLLIESKLDDDVSNFELELYLLSKMVKASVSFGGEVHLDAEQVNMLIFIVFIVLHRQVIASKWFGFGKQLRIDSNEISSPFKKADNESKVLSGAFLQRTVWETVYWVKNNRKKEGFFTSERYKFSLDFIKHVSASTSGFTG